MQKSFHKIRDTCDRKNGSRNPIFSAEFRQFAKEYEFKHVKVRLNTRRATAKRN